MMPEKFATKRTALRAAASFFTEIRFFLPWITDKIGDDWITDLSNVSKLKLYVSDEKPARNS